MVEANDPQGSEVRPEPARTLAIITCHARLAHLRETLPRVASHFETLVVDYNDPQDSAIWVRRFAEGGADGIARPHVHSLRVPWVPSHAAFWKTGALNAGLVWALHHGFDRVLLLDADTVLEKPEEIVRELGELAEGEFLLAGRVNGYDLPGLTGVLGARLVDFDQIGGFDDSFTGYGCEDVDMRLELVALGRVPRWFSRGLFRAIKHDDAARVIHRSPGRTVVESWSHAHSMLLDKWSRRLGCALERGLDFPLPYRTVLFHNATAGGPQ